MAWVSATAAAGSATTPLFHARPVASARLLHECRTHERPVNQRPKNVVGSREKRIGGVDVDGADNGAYASTRSRTTGLGDELVKQIADAARANGAGSRLEPRQIVGVERHRDSTLTHTISY